MTEDNKETPPSLPSLEQRTTQAGRKPGDRYVKIHHPSEFRRHEGHYVVTDEALAPKSVTGRAYEAVRRVLIGPRLETEADATERLNVFTGLAILGSDNISSSAYATEEAMRILAIAGAAGIFWTSPVALAVVGVLAIVVLSQSQVIRAYPNGGGSYVVASDNLGTLPGLVAAAALLIDYVLTVATSTAAGVEAITSFVPDLYSSRLVIGLAFIGLLMIGNLRGVREAGILFAGPTYVYIAALVALVGYGIFRVATGDIPQAAVPPNPFPATGAALITPFLVLRAFASGSVGLTGSEAIANGVPSMKQPERRHALITLVLMGTTFGAIFLGLTFLAQTIGVTPDEKEVESLNSLVTRSLVGQSWFYYVVQGSTALLLALAANTGFTGFPRLASVMAHDRFMPRQFSYRGERLAFSFGIVALALVSAFVLAAFNGSVTNLIPLYTIGVFLAFTLAQAGLMRRWRRLRTPWWRVRWSINLLGAVVTAVVLVVVVVTKFTEGAWLVTVTLPLLVFLSLGIHGHYRRVADALTLDRLDRPLPATRPPLVIVPIARLDRAAVGAIAFARSISPQVRAVHVTTSAESAKDFTDRWERWAGKVPMEVIESPYRSLVPPLLKYIDVISRQDERAVTIVLSSFVPHHWWEFLLHSQTSFRLKASLLFRPNTVVIDVPYHLHDGGVPGRERRRR